MQQPWMSGGCCCCCWGCLNTGGVCGGGGKGWRKTDGCCCCCGCGWLKLMLRCCTAIAGTDEDEDDVEGEGSVDCCLANLMPVGSNGGADTFRLVVRMTLPASTWSTHPPAAIAGVVCLLLRKLSSQHEDWSWKCEASLLMLSSCSATRPCLLQSCSPPSMCSGLESATQSRFCYSLRWAILQAIDMYIFNMFKLRLEVLWFSGFTWRCVVWTIPVGSVVLESAHVWESGRFGLFLSG